jgi:hypothetical protein
MGRPTVKKVRRGLYFLNGRQVPITWRQSVDNDTTYSYRPSVDARSVDVDGNKQGRGWLLAAFGEYVELGSSGQLWR